MLAVTRKKNETIEIYVPGFDPIVIKTLETKAGRVCLGIQSSKEIQIKRGEIVERTQGSCGSNAAHTGVARIKTFRPGQERASSGDRGE